ncbi:MAG: nucleoside-diphosphate sugar epimerase/dehydratase [Rickettsiales bacterium]
MKLYKFNRSTRDIVAIAHDTLMAALSFLLAVYIRLGDEQIEKAYHYLFIGTSSFTLICITVFVYMRLYRGSWRYVSIKDLIAIVKAVTLSVLIFAVFMFIFNRLEGMPRSVLFINWMLLLVLLGGSRSLYRIVKDQAFNFSFNSVTKIPVLLIGADDSAEQFIRNSQRDPEIPYEVVGLVDDDPVKRGRTIHRVSVYGDSDVIPTIVRKLERKGRRPQKLVVSNENTDAAAMGRLLDIADSLGIAFARLPKISEFKQGIVEKNTIRPIAVEDLLGRPQNVLDRKAMRELIESKKVLVTGAGGTIGGELARQISSYNPSELIIMEMNEFNIYQIERELRGKFPYLSLNCVLGDVRNKEHVANVFSKYSPELVFHAAAIKHVPIAEYNIEEAILTNVFGSQNIAEACLKYNIESMVLISTDKAVNPTNVMGASKRLAESYCQALGRGEQESKNREKGTKFITVRFGNVLGSTGSVVPLFNEQLANGGPLTVTDPEMTRYFMTVREAVELVLQAAVLGNEMQEKREYIFVLDMGQPVKILDLALQMIKLAGLKPYADIDIIFTGLRPGEKLYEELFHLSENIVETTNKGIFLASPREADIKHLRKAFLVLYDECRNRNSKESLELLKQLVPEFTTKSSI